MTSFSSCLRHCRLALPSLLLTVLLAACGGGNDAPLHYPLGGSVNGLAGGTLVLQVNDGETVSLSADGTFQFPTELPRGTAYVVSVQTQPNNPAQTCSVSQGSGTLNAAVNDIAVHCSTNAYSIGGTVSGLTGQGLMLRNNGGDDLPIDADGSFQFSQPVASGATYLVTVVSQPNAPAQTCSVNQSSSIVANANVTDVQVVCNTNSYTVGGTVTGLNGSGLVLRNNGGDDLTIDADGSFQFPQPVASGADYTVTVSSQPPGQICTVNDGTGTVGNTEVTDVQVSCAVESHYVGGTLSGLANASLVLQNNGGDDLTVAFSPWKFPTPVALGSNYNVTVATQPHTRRCSVVNGTGTMGNADVTDVQINCVTEFHSVIVDVTGMGSDTDLSVQINHVQTIHNIGNGPHKFPTELESGSSYGVVIALPPPANHSCTVYNGAGIMGIEDAHVQVDCIPS